MADVYPPARQRAALRKFATAITCTATALQTDGCGDPQLVGKHGHVYATPVSGGALSRLCFQLFVTTESARAWTAAKKALNFAKVWKDGDEEGSLILHRLGLPSVTILLEMAGYSSLTEWLARPLPKEHVRALSPEARRERKRAPVRVCKAKARRERQLKKIAEADAIRAAGRDIFDLSPRVLICKHTGPSTP